MKPRSVSVTGVGTTNPLLLNRDGGSFSVGFVAEVTGTVTYTVEHTYDDIMDSAVTPVWYTNASVGSSSATKEGAYTTPVVALRVNASAGTGTVKLTVVEVV